ncbi:helix-turn-helix domain-containing protein [Rubrobacter indicoceani]|uniref:helix-turn-helix domain-containing protein n=1 Tax=Rubrobacter indicoceani TaxID=2051957 RepID=UPI000E5BC8B6|nr:XRE family transcriptional regulator [Rubrobacter indicoceani]
MITQEELGGRLRRARSEAGITQGDAGRAAGLDDTAIAKIERGKRGVGALEIKRLASLYGIPVDDLLEDPVAEGLVPLTVALRSVEEASPSRVERMKRQMQRLVSDDRWLREGDDASVAWEPVDLHTISNEPDYRRGYRLADKFRARYELGDSPVPDLAMLADEIGVVVARMPLGDVGAPDGCSALDPETGFAYVLINSDKSRVRRRFTIAHELGHLVSGHLNPGEVVLDETLNEKNPQEQEANAFAAGLLMPESGVCGAVKRLQGKLGEEDPVAWIVWLADSFGVSEEAAAYRLVNLKLAKVVGGKTREAVREVAEDLEGQREARARLGLSLAMRDSERGVTEVGPSMRARISRALEVGEISVDGAARMLHLSPEETDRWIVDSGIRLGVAEAPL